MEVFTPEEQDLLAAVPAALRSGTELLEWWRKLDADGYPDVYTFPETRVFNRPEDRSFGFFDSAPLSTGTLKVNGNVQEMFYDDPKSPPERRRAKAQWIDEQVREFVLRYFMRISDFRQPQQLPEPHDPPPPGFGFLSQCPAADPERVGFGFSQLFYKGSGGELGRFRESRRDAIVDLRKMGEDFEWIVLRNPIFDFSFKLKPFGEHGPQLVLPISEFNYLIVSPEFVIDERQPEEGVLGRYGFGYAFVRDPQPSPLSYGPGQLEPAFELLVWDVHESGRVTVRAAFVAQEPTAMLRLALDPFAWGVQLTSVFFGSPQVKSALAPFKRFYNSLPGSQVRFDPVFPAIELANFMTLGQAEKRFCISTTHLKKEFLFLHFMQHYQTILGSLQTWRQIPDWLDRDAMPAFVVDGRSS